jgi:hypothetical protein
MTFQKLHQKLPLVDQTKVVLVKLLEIQKTLQSIVFGLVKG